MILPFFVDLPTQPIFVRIIVFDENNNRNTFPRCRNWEAGSPPPAGCRRR